MMWLKVRLSHTIGMFSLYISAVSGGALLHRSGGFDSSKKAGIRCGTVSIFTVDSAKEECTWQVMH